MMSPPADESVEVQCVGCQQSGRRRDLERFVYHESVGLVFDMRGGAPGDAVFVHPLPGCIRAASWAGFSRAFETPLRELDGDKLVGEVREGIETRLKDNLREASRLGILAVGRGPVERVAGDGELEIVLVDERAGNNTRQFAERLEKRDETVRFEISDGLLSEAIGQKVAISGVSGDERSDQVGRTTEKLICMTMETNEG